MYTSVINFDINNYLATLQFGLNVLVKDSDMRLACKSKTVMAQLKRRTSTMQGFIGMVAGIGWSMYSQDSLYTSIMAIYNGLGSMTCNDMGLHMGRIQK